MGYLSRGTWMDEWYDTASSGGRFVRQDSRFRSRVSQGGDYPPEPGRYHLYVSWACPWASRTMIYRALKGLTDFPELWDYTRTLYQVPGVAETVHFDHIKRHYYGSHRTINPTGVVAAGPRIDFSAPTRRAVPRLESA